MNGERFAGTVTQVGKYFGFIQVDDTNTKVLFHRDICDMVNFRELRIGDRLRFRLIESKSYPGKFAASRITYEVKS